MNSQLFLILIPVFAAVLSGVVVLVRQPSDRVRSGIQHFAAGVVFAGVAGEIIPDLEKFSPVIPVIGFAIGVPLILIVSKVSKRLAKQFGGSTGLITAAAVDLALDGLPVGIGFAIGGKTGLILTIALTLELFFIGLAVAGSAKRRSKLMTIGIPSALGILFGISALIGALVFKGVSANVQAVVLAVGAAVFLYLAAEELLTEAHEVEETSLSLSLFFAGFLALLVIEMTFR